MMVCPASLPYVTWRITLRSASVRASRDYFSGRPATSFAIGGLNWALLIVLVLNLIAAAMVLEFEVATPTPTSPATRMRCGGR